MQAVYIREWFFFCGFDIGERRKNWLFLVLQFREQQNSKRIKHHDELADLIVIRMNVYSIQWRITSV